jgi:hypothetical protein
VHSSRHNKHEELGAREFQEYVSMEFLHLVEHLLLVVWCLGRQGSAAPLWYICCLYTAPVWLVLLLLRKVMLWKALDAYRKSRLNLTVIITSKEKTD